MVTFEGTDLVRAILTDPHFAVPAPAAAPTGLGWLRAHVARFSTGPAHERRRAIVTTLLADLDPAALHRAARAASPHTAPDDLPVRVLAMGLRAAPERLAEIVALVSTVAAGYLPPGAATPETDRAVERLAALLARPGQEAEHTANRIGLLVQACNATAALIRTARQHHVDIDTALSIEPPARSTRRIALEARTVGGRHVPAGTTVTLGLAGLPFGAGPHRCPGERHARAIAEGATR